jgi:predicted acetyltransferase
MTIEIRAAAPAEHRTLSDTVANALLFPPRDDEGWAKNAPSWHEPSSFGAWDGAVCAGNVSQFFVDTTVPGGAGLPTGAVSRVAVLPTYRRRGVATSLMHRLIDDAVERGLVLMSLRASETVIYERYGFGLAGEFVSAAITPARALPIRGAAPGGSFRFIARDEVLATVKPIYTRSLHRRPGLITRAESWWGRYFEDATTPGKSAYVVVHTDDAGVDDGYVSYGVEWAQPETEGGRGEVHEVVAVDDAAELALWQYVLSIDLVNRWTCDERPIDDVLRTALHDPRAYRIASVDDEQWVRLVDVERALTARTYAPVTSTVTVAVNDPRVDRNNGTWRIDATGAERVTEPATLRVDIAVLSAAYLGGTSWHALTAAGRVESSDPAAIAIADTLFASRPLPFCGSFF